MKRTKMFLTAILLVATSWLAKAQTPTACTVNPCTSNPPPTCEYVCNRSFEINNMPPTALGSGSFDQVSLTCGWGNANSATTPDYYYSTATNSVVKVPCNQNGKEPERTGQKGYCGFLASSGLYGTWCERISSALTTTLNANKVYEVSFWLSLGESSTQNEVNNVGFTIGPESGGTYFTNPIRYVDAAAMASVSKDGWTKMTYTYSTNGNYNGIYIVVGSFHDLSGAPSNSFVTYSGSSSTVTCSGYSYGTDWGTYYFLDDISVKEITTLSVTANQVTGCIGESFSLTATGGANSYFWSPSTALSCTNCANPVSTATTSITYTVTGTSTASCVYDPATITISPYSCCANPASGNFTLRDVRLVNYTTTGVPAWSSLTSGGFYTGDIAVPSNSIITNTLTIVNTLSIATTVTFNTCNMVICEDDVIQQYSVTTINHSLLKGDVSTLWEGIYSYSKALYITNSWIEDAHIVANLGNTFTGGATHDGLYIDNVIFNKNYNAIATSGYTMDPGAFRIKGSIFTCRSLGTPDYTTTTRYTSTYNPSTKVPAKIKGSTYYSITNNTIRSNIGVLMGASVSNTSNPTHFTIGEGSATPSVNTSYTNRFDYLNEGIVNSNGKVNIYNNGFSNITTVSTGTSLGAVYHLSWYGGYASTNVGATPSYYKNVFGVNSTGQIQDGVTAVGGGSLNVSYNDFSIISRYGVNVQSWNAPVPSTHTVLVTNNSFSTTSYAFYANNNQSITASISSNTLVQTQPTYTTTGYGVYINEVNKPANANYLINLNNFSQGLNSIYITNTKNARIIDNIVQVKKPSSTSIFNGDIWLDNDENTFVKGNTLSCNPTNSSSWNTFGIFQSASIGNTLKCNTIYSVSACIKAQSTCSPTTMYFNSLNNTGGNDACFLGLWLDNNATFGDIGYKNGSNWEQSDDIWGDFLTGSGGADTKCQVNSNPNTSPPYKIYYDNSNSGPKPLSLYQPQVNISTPSFSDASQSFSPVPNGTTNSQGCSEISRLMNSSLTTPGRSVGNNPNGAHSSSVSSSAEFENDANYGLGSVLRKKLIILKTGDSNARQITNNDDAFWLVDSLMTLYAQSKSSAIIGSAINSNAAIITQNTIEQNQKNFNEVYCVFLQADSLVSVNQIQTIQNMAALCPFTDGLAVYQARALIRNWDDSTRYYNVCENNVPDLGNSSRLTNQSNQTPDIKPTVYPNPTTGNLMVNSNCKDCIFEVYDLIGKKVMSQKLNETETKVDISSLNTGTYLYKITQNGALLKADKLILNK